MIDDSTEEEAEVEKTLRFAVELEMAESSGQTEAVDADLETSAEHNNLDITKKPMHQLLKQLKLIGLLKKS